MLKKFLRCFSRLNQRAERLFFLLEQLRDERAEFILSRSLDRKARGEASPFVLLRCDVHAVGPKELICFGRELAKRSLPAAFLFLAPDHPANLGRLSPQEQLTAMRELEGMGHETGVHLDPHYLISGQECSLEDILREMLSVFSANGIKPVTGSIHGNSRYKGLDENGFGTAFDFFAELGRQPDFPKLSNVHPELAESIRRNRISLESLNFDTWIDQPLWTRKNGFMVTNYISDNGLAKSGTLSVTLQPDSMKHLKLADHQPPGALTCTAARELVPLKGGGMLEPPFTGTRNLDFFSAGLDGLVKVLPSVPLLFLLHPQHYVEGAP
ncbi:hypothetical protein [Desulfovibrio sp. JC010]|uniref:hypothetical protein n=1 Tax=Desulfovibrio sp. JC010 TaxID=2593641 RepID=UPI0013D439EB|nr:hypothetical protein [Desulfovibrio sp. JC010]NDV27499.1 hypothetical protein [Desulfovibrio sp. JC010]